jgi:hypothetical protein
MSPTPNRRSTGLRRRAFLFLFSSLLRFMFILFFCPLRFIFLLICSLFSATQTSTSQRWNTKFQYRKDFIGPGTYDVPSSAFVVKFQGLGSVLPLCLVCSLFVGDDVTPHPLLVSSRIRFNFFVSGLIAEKVT